MCLSKWIAKIRSQGQKGVYLGKGLLKATKNWKLLGGMIADDPKEHRA